MPIDGEALHDTRIAAWEDPLCVRQRLGRGIRVAKGVRDTPRLPCDPFGL